MNRSFIVALLVAAIVVSAGCEKKDLLRTGLVKVAKHTYAFIATGPTAVEGHGANSGFVVGSAGVLVIDSRYTPALAEELLKAIRSVTDAPIKYVVDTNYHPDHAWGNAVFKEHGATIVASPETGDALVKYSPEYLEFYRTRSQEAFDMVKDVKIVPPDTTCTDRTTFDLGGVTVVLRFFGGAETAGDVAVVVPEDRVLFTGGLAANGYHLNMADPGADYDNWFETLDKLGNLGIRSVVPGRGKICGKEALEADKCYIRTLREACIDAIKRRVPLKDAVATITVPGTEKFLQPNLLPFNILAIYRAEIPAVVRTDFTLDLPPDFLIADGGGSAKRGMIRWTAESKGGPLEIEVGWEPFGGAEVIRQDVADRVAKYGTSSLRSMGIEGYTKIDVGGEQAIAAFGRWSYAMESPMMGGGRWLWALALRSGTLYSIRLSTEAQGQKEQEEANIEALKKIVATFKVIAPAAPKAPA
jgi:cyclase